MSLRLRRLLVPAAVAAGSALLVVGLLHTPPARSLLLDWARSRARVGFGVALEAERLDCNLLTLSFRLSKVRLSKVPLQADPAPVPFFEADAVDVDLPWSILRGSLAIESLQLTRPRVAIVRGADGALNLPSGRPGGAPLQRLAIGRASISHASVLYEDQPRALRVVVSALDATLLGGRGTGIAGEIAAREGLRFDWGTARFDASRFDGHVLYDGAAVGIDPLRLRTPEGDLEARGRIGVFGATPEIDLTYRGIADVGLVAARWPTIGPVAGSLGLTGRINGRLGDPALRIEFAGGVVGGTVTGTARFPSEADHADPVIAVDYFDVDLRHALRAARSTLPFRVSGRLAGRGELTWRRSDRDGLRAVLENETRATDVRDALGLSGRATLRVDRGQWTVTHAHTLGGAIDISGEVAGRLAAAPGGPPSIAGDAIVRVRDLAGAIHDIDRAGLDLKPLITAALTGRGDASLTLSGSLESPRAAGSLRLADFSVASSVPARVETRVDLDAARLRLDGLELIAQENVLRGRASITFANRALDGALRAELGRVEDWLQFVPERWRPAASIDALGELGGTLEAPRLNLAIAGRRVDIAGQRFDRFSAKAQLAGASLVVDDATLSQETSARGFVRAAGRYDFSRGAYALKISGSNVDVTPVPAAAGATPLPIGARTDLEFEGAGTLDRPVGRGQIVVQRLRWDRFEIGPARAAVALDGHVGLVELTAPELQFTAAGSVAIAAPHRFTLTSRITDGDLARWIGPALGPGREIRGGVSLTVEGSGDLDHLESTEAEVAVDRLAATLGRGSLQLDAPARLRYAAGQLAASDVTLRSGRTTLRASGLLSGRPEDSTLSLAADGDLQDLEPWLLELTGLSLGAGGSVHARARVAGTARRPNVNGDLTIDAGALTVPGVPPFADLRVRATFQEDTLQIGEVQGAWQGAAIAVSGRVPAALFARWLPKSYLDGLGSADRTAHITATAAPLTRQALAPWLSPETLAQIDGEAAATLTIDADAPDLKSLRGELVLDRLALTVAHVPLNQEAPTRLRLAGGRLSVVDWRWGGPTSHLQIAGAVTLEDRPRIEAEARGTSDLRSVGAFIPAIAAAGQAEFEVRLQGDARDPDLSGRVRVSSGELRVRSPRVVVSGLTGTIEFTGSRVIVRDMTGTANGGAVRLSGELERDRLTPVGGALTANASGVAFEWPKGLRTELAGEVSLKPAGQVVTLGGTVTVRRGAYREPLVLTQQALAALRATQAGVPGAPKESWLERVRLDIAVTSSEPVTVDNNYGQFDLGADLHLLGSLDSPALTGRLTMREGGKLFLGGNVFRVDRGTIDFVDPRGMKPDLTFTARTRVSSYEIVLSATGPPDSLTVDLTSDDTRLTKSDLASLLLTGERAGDSPYATSQQVSAQMLTLLSGDLLGFMGQRVGLDAVRVERGGSSDVFGADLGLLSTETKDPGTRLSVTKRIGPEVDFVLSQNLRENGGLTWIVVYRPGRDIEIRGVSRDDGSRSIEASQQLTFGGAALTPRATGRPQQPRIADVRFTGAPGLPEAELRAQIKLTPGRSLDFYQWQKDRDALERLYRTRGRLEARISARREETEATEGTAAVLEYAIQAGPRTELRVDGYDLPSSLRREIEDAWADSVFDGFLLDDVRAKTLLALARANYLRAEATAEIAVRDEAGQSVKTLHLRITPGPPTSVRTIGFTGNAEIPTSRLQALVRQRGLDPAAWLSPADLESAIADLYEGEGYFSAAVSVGAPRFDGGSSVLPVSIVEGAPFAVGDVNIEGARAHSESDVRSAFGLRADARYQAGRVEAGRQAVEAAYRRDGFNGAEVRIVRGVDRVRRKVDMRLIVTEGPRQILAGVDLAGVGATRAGVVARALRADVGAPVNLDEWSRARTRLYETGVFRSADIRFVPESPPEPGPQPTEPVRAIVTLDEVEPYRFRYGVQLGDEPDSTQGVAERVTTYGVLADLQRRNMFGQALTAGLAGRYEKNQWAGRLYLTAPHFFTLPYRTSVYLTRTHETVTTAPTFSYVDDRWTATAEQQARWRQALRLIWGYRYERSHVFEPNADPSDPFALNVTLNVARLTSALTADTRDDPFAPHRGWFSGATLEYSTPVLGSDLKFLKTLLQGYYFRAAGLAVLASAARLGTITGPNTVVSELFLAGGGTTVRGYAENSLGPVDLSGDPIGGKAMIVLNQEVRFPIVWWFEGVGFVDAGNVFVSASDLSLADLKVGVGGGLRLNTPFALFRLDLGVPVSRRPGEPRARWYFSLGHIF